MDGADDLVLIGRAEQADLLHGMSSSYACANCCPASFAGGWCDPDSVSGLPGDTTQFRAWEQKEDCYGTVLGPFLRSAGWSSLNTTVATVTTGGLATARNPGSTKIRANFGTQYVWVENGMTCSRTSFNFIAEAICDVVKGEITFLTAKIFSLTANFELSVGFPVQTATLKAGSSSYANEICGDNPQEFTLTVKFRLPPNSVLVPSRCTARPEEIPDNDYSVGTPTTKMDNTVTGEGHMSVSVRRRCCGGGDQKPSINITIAGNRTNGTGVVDTRGKVRILCGQ